MPLLMLSIFRFRLRRFDDDYAAAATPMIFAASFRRRYLSYYASRQASSSPIFIFTLSAFAEAVSTASFRFHFEFSRYAGYMLPFSPLRRY
jgi:hypothetical protein